MALESDDLIIVQKGDGSHAKATVGDIAIDGGIPDLQAVTEEGATSDQKITLSNILYVGDDIRTGPDESKGVEIHGDKGIVHIKPVR